MRKSILLMSYLQGQSMFKFTQICYVALLEMLSYHVKLVLHDCPKWLLHSFKFYLSFSESVQ